MKSPDIAAALSKQKAEYEAKLRDLRAENKELVEDAITAKWLREVAFELSEYSAAPPKWLADGIRHESAF